ncbi:MAG TPA: ATP-binding protein, partial [Anaerolineae bacterium]|nr:ATP-binding protein [Anaerolineae bacterium]
MSAKQSSPPSYEQYIPEPKSVEETGLSMGFIADLVLKLVYYKSEMSSLEIAEALALPYVGIMDKVLEFLKREEYIEVSGSKGFGERGYQWVITGKGSDRAVKALE